MRYRRCTKRRYETEAEAKAALESLQQPRRTQRATLKRHECRVYACLECCAWHITSQDQERALLYAG